MDNKMDSRRKFLKKAAYVAPFVVTLQAVPSFASSGSGFGPPGGGPPDNRPPDNRPPDNRPPD
jgi:hypothetical protein